jgi:NtrC-family two-component system sensor histidine kinase KinB
MKRQSLRKRFLLAGAFLIAAALGCGAWSVFTFARLSATAGQTLANSQQRIDLIASLASILEREDDALLLCLAGEPKRALDELAHERRHFEETFADLQTLLDTPEEHQAADDLRRHADTYRNRSDALLAETGRTNGREAYHERVNPALREAVGDCGRLRELSFRTMQQAALQARNQAAHASGIVALLTLTGLACSILVAIRLARAILGPVRELTRGVEAIRQDDFAHRVRVDTADELGQLAEGFNRMAQTLSDYRQSSLGELLLAKRTLESTLAALPDAVIVVDPAGQIASRNALANQVLKALGAEEATRLESLPFPAGVMRAVEEFLRGNRPPLQTDFRPTLEVSLDGRPLRMLVMVSPIPEYQPRRLGAVIVLADVTDFARLDELRGELIAVASHELKTPLTSLRMNLLLLQERASNLSARQQEILTAAVEGGEQLANTIDELLDLTRIEAGQLRLQHQHVDLNTVVEQVARTLRPRFDDANVALRIRHHAPQAGVHGDAARLRIVFLNLLDNALKYSPPGREVVLQLVSDARAAADGQPCVSITVTDSGPGIPAEFRERVFEKFFRVEHHTAERSTGVRGVGIGLYLCRQIIEAHGGVIRCEAGDTGGGTRIIIQLELAECGNPLPVAP